MGEIGEKRGGERKGDRRGEGREEREGEREQGLRGRKERRIDRVAVGNTVYTERTYNMYVTADVHVRHSRLL